MILVLLCQSPECTSGVSDSALLCFGAQVMWGGSGKSRMNRNLLRSRPGELLRGDLLLRGDTVATLAGIEAPSGDYHRCESLVLLHGFCCLE